MRKMRGIFLVLILAVVFCMTTACQNGQSETKKGDTNVSSSQNQTGNISVISREEGSGTRDSFVQITGVMQKDEEGRDVDRTVSQAEIAQDAGQVIEKVEQDETAIGYISLGEYLQYKGNKIKAINIDGAEASKDAVASNEYELSRSFSLAYSGKLNDLQEDFMRYVTGKGQEIVDQSYIAVEKPETFLSLKPEGTLVIDGSTSVAPLMQELVDGYQKENPKAKIQIHISDSTSGLTAAMQGSCDFAMSSRELKDYEKELLNEQTIARDGIAVIVNKENSLSDCSMEQLQKIFVGEITSYDEIN